VDIDVEFIVPNTKFNEDLLSEPMRVDLHLAKKTVSRALVLPRISPAAQQLRELLWAVPMAFGLWYDEQVIKLPLLFAVSPQDLLVTSPGNRTVAADPLGVTSHVDVAPGLAKLRLSPALTVRAAQLHLRPRFAGPLGRLLSSFLGFVPICACLIYLGRYGRSEAPAPHKQLKCETAASNSPVQMSFVEIQMLAKALGGHFNATYPATLEAFEAEDRAAHDGELRGQVKLDKLPIITARAQHEWKVHNDQWQLRNIIGATLSQTPTEGGLVTPDGCLHYRSWLALTMVSLFCGKREFSDYADWLAQHPNGRKTSPPSIDKMTPARLM